MELVSDKKDKSEEIKEKKDAIIKELRSKGFRVTEQRKLIIDIILENECSCCKEIYYEALEKDSSIGIATVYRMVRTLEEMGAMNRRQIYQLTCGRKEVGEAAAHVMFEDGMNPCVEIPAGKWHDLLKQELAAKGYVIGEDFLVVIKKICHYCGEEENNDQLYCGD